MICKHCNKEINLNYYITVRDRLIETSRCFECDFWVNMVRADRLPANDARFIVTPEYQHYRIGDSQSKVAAHRGSYGRTFIVTWLDTTRMAVKTNDLWSQGEIPERHRHRFTPNGSPKEAPLKRRQTHAT